VTLALSACAFLGATISGFVGMAGGVLLLVLMYLLGLEPAVAIPVHAVVQILANSSRWFVHRQHVKWASFALFAVAAIPGPLLGLWLVERIDESVAKAGLGVVTLLAAWLPKGKKLVSGDSGFAIAGALGGVFGVVVGAIGPIIAPFLLGRGYTRYEIIATHAACALFLHIVKLVAFSSIGFAFGTYVGWIVPMSIAAVLGTLAGKALLGRVDDKGFRLIYKLVLTILAVRLCLAPFWA
jgi:uncharacterized membrane protein YfcA